MITYEQQMKRYRKALSSIVLQGTFTNDGAERADAMQRIALEALPLREGDYVEQS
jgi:hypothetical protein